jgi:HEAT repeat protein
MVNDIPQLLLQCQAASDASDWSLLIQYLQQLVLETDSKHPEIVNNQAKLLQLAISVVEMGDFRQRWEVTKILTALGEMAILPLSNILSDSEADAELRWYAARILGEFPHPDAVQPLIEILHGDESEELQSIAVTALAQMGKIAVAAISELLAETDTRLLAVRSLSQIRSPATITPLLSVVNDQQPEIRATAIEALSSFHDERIPPVLIAALNDTSAQVRRFAVLGLGFRPDLQTELDLANQLQPRLYDMNLEVCRGAIVALSRLGGDDAAKYLFELLILPHTPVTLQLEIIRALSWIETQPSLRYLQQALSYLDSPTTWQEIITVLGRVKQPQLTALATEILLAMLPDSGTETVSENSRITSHGRCAIALSLGQLGQQQAIAPLTSLSTDTDDRVRLHAIAALKHLVNE